ncbi:hypothetical protein GH714_036834 [Hevea brasiliensis]|uniref:SWIM-type domain-containing protein n=1 Tax=Hevea brasiliensis TaxID=3981 RepID=A0A6A6KHJ1_HEVBR|nr:hypothetical protein GH714_036834 [Hevea brasiliensis]
MYQICCLWDLNGIPCAHACLVIFGNNEHPKDFIHECYKVDTYAKVFAHYINPINGYEMWPRPSTRYSFTHPDPIEKKRGRKRKARRKEIEELEQAQVRGKLCRKGVVSIKCSICGQTGHNKRHHGVDGKISTLTTKGKRATPTKTHEGNTRITTKGQGQANASNSKGASHTSKGKRKLSVASKLKVRESKANGAHMQRKTKSTKD